MPDSPPRRAWWIDAFTWAATALMLITYLAMTLQKLPPRTPFLICQLVGQLTLAAVSFSRRAWQPGVANLFFAGASLAGLIHLHFFAE